MNPDPNLPRRLLESVLARPEFGSHTGRGEGLPVPGAALASVAIGLVLVVFVLAIVSSRRHPPEFGSKSARSARVRLIQAAALGSLLIAVVVFQITIPRASGGPLSVRDSSPQGARALCLWLRELGYTVRTGRGSLTSLGGKACLFVLEPTRAVSSAEADSLIAWVERGGVLFLAPGSAKELDDAVERWVELDFDRTSAAEVQGDRMVLDDGAHWRYRALDERERGMFAYPVSEVAVLGDGRVRDVGGEQRVLFAREGQGLLAEIFHGEGVVIVLPVPDLLTNEGIAKADNVELVASLLEDWVPRELEIRFSANARGG